MLFSNKGDEFSRWHFKKIDLLVEFLFCSLCIYSSLGGDRTSFSGGPPFRYAQVVLSEPPFRDQPYGSRAGWLAGWRVVVVGDLRPRPLIQFAAVWVWSRFPLLSSSSPSPQNVAKTTNCTTILKIMLLITTVLAKSCLEMLLKPMV